MMRSKTIAVLFYLGAVVIGAAAGVAVDRKMVHQKIDRMRDDPRMSRDEFFTMLGLSETQRKSWDSIFDARRRADSILIAPVRAQERALRPQRDSIGNATYASLRALLSPEQVKLWDEFRTKQQDERRQRPGDGRR
jgi:hypothetical protein